ncbi:MAG: ribosome maturation factor RimM [Anaerolineales bacterium]
MAVGRIVRPHGLRGLLVVDSPMNLADRLLRGTTVYLGGKRSPVEVQSVQPHGSGFLVGLAGVRDREAAEARRDAVVYAVAADLRPLAPGVHYRSEVVGLAVRTEQGETVGRVARVLPSPAHDLYEIVDPQGRTFLLPASRAFILGMDTEAGVMTVRLVPGLRPE